MEHYFVEAIIRKLGFSSTFDKINFYSAEWKYWSKVAWKCAEGREALRPEVRVPNSNNCARLSILDEWYNWKKDTRRTFRWQWRRPEIKDLGSVRPNIVPYGTFGGRKWRNIPAEDSSIIFFLSSGITGIFLFSDILSDYSSLKWNIPTILPPKCNFILTLWQLLWWIKLPNLFWSYFQTNLIFGKWDPRGQKQCIITNRSGNSLTSSHLFGKHK